MLRVLTRALMGLVVGAGAVVGGAPAAHADGSIYGYDGTLWQGCSNYDYGYNLSYPGATSWDMEVTTYTPTGEYSDTSYSSGAGSSADGVGRANVCDYEGVGRYSLEAEVTWYDEGGNYLDSDYLSSGFRLAKRVTKTALSVSDLRPAYNQRVRITSTSRNETRSGRYRALAYEWVYLEARCGGAWSKVRQSRQVTNDMGKAVWRYRWNIRRTCDIRAVSESTPSTMRSQSVAKRINVTNNRTMSNGRAMATLPGFR